MKALFAFGIALVTLGGALVVFPVIICLILGVLTAGGANIVFPPISYFGGLTFLQVVPGAIGIGMVIGFGGWKAASVADKAESARIHEPH